MNYLHKFDIISFQNDLLAWYEHHQRKLPWRENKDPYSIWISEIMLQQTKVDTVIPYFNRFKQLFPTVFDLAKADEQAVLKAWEGLGYYSRARNLHHAAKQIVEQYDGVMPSNPKELGALKGIGPYTKGAILSIAFNQPEPAVDGNVMRVYSRLLKIEENIADQKVRKLFESVVCETIAVQDPSSFNQAVMELGALVCTPKSPSCLLCPVQQYCRAFQEGIESELPIKSKAKKQRVIPYVVLLLEKANGSYAIQQRPSEGLLANLWQFPMMPIAEIGFDHIENWVQAEYGLTIQLGKKCGELRHVFSHIIWEIEIYHAQVIEDEEDHAFQFVLKEELDTYPFPTSHINIMKKMED